MIAIITARGGSKGLPRKNIKLFDGKPLIAYTIEAALNAKNISRVIISTDDDEIASVSKEFGAEVPFMRPDSLATDNATTLDVLKYTIQKLEDDEHISISDFVLLQPTSPLRNSKHIDEAIDLFNEKDAYSVISCCKEEHPIFWNKFVTEQGKFENIFDKDFIENRQNIRDTYRPNGAIYVFNKLVLTTGRYYESNTYAYIMDRHFSVDIDTILDFKYAELLKQNL